MAKGLGVFLLVVLGLVVLGTILRFFGLWFRALLSGARVGMLNIIGMALRLSLIHI